MSTFNDRPIVLVIRKTRLEALINRFNTVDQARFYVESLSADFNEYQQEHERYQAALLKAKQLLSQSGRGKTQIQVLERSFLSNYLFAPDAIVVALGQDGLVANILKYLNGQPLIGINPEPQRYDGVLLPFVVEDIALILGDVIQRRRSQKQVTMASCTLSDGQTMLAVNDLFIGPQSHTSARYALSINNDTEQQSSSGVIVSTGLGSTGWMKSILTGSQQIAGGEVKNRKALRQNGFDWGADYLYFSVREPFPSQTSEARLIFGQVSNKKPLTIVSQMPENGVIFSDGIEQDYLAFTAGISATVNLADKVGQLVV